jgi:hypothetical protein
LKKLLVAGGRLRPNGYELGDGKYYDKAILMQLDLDSGVYTELLSKEQGNENYPAEHPNLQYTAPCLEGDILWLPTDTEIYKYQLPELKELACFSHPCFQNLHSAHIFNDELVVTSTGLDNVVVMNKESGEIKDIFGTEGKGPWYRFDVNTDYRQVHSTRPHVTHPNYVFKIDDDYWVTRCGFEDAVKINDVSDKIKVGQKDIIAIHDGIGWGDKLVFTRVDGFIVVCDPKTREVLDKHDPFENERNRPLGWCRGLCIEDDIFYIGYSKLRKTKLKSKLKYLTKGNFKFTSGNNSLVVAYDMKNKKVLRIYESEDHVIDAIYGILPYHYE